MSYIAELDIDTPHWNAFKLELKLLPDNARLAGKTAVRGIAGNFYLDVRSRYRTITEPPLKESTKERRRYGRPRSSSISPLFRTGSLVDKVQIRYGSTKRTFTGVVNIRPNVRLKGGGISHLVAENNEFGKSYTITITDKMIRYLRMLLKKSGRYDEIMGKRRAKNPNPGMIIGTIPPRPVWVPAMVALTAKQPLDFAARFFAILNTKCKLLSFKAPKV